MKHEKSFLVKYKTSDLSTLTWNYVFNGQTFDIVTPDHRAGEGNVTMPQFLTDDPAGSTNNAYKIHGAMANAITADIRGKAPNSASKRRIAIIGEWGSEKSTVISLLEGR